MQFEINCFGIGYLICLLAYLFGDEKTQSKAKWCVVILAIIHFILFLLFISL